MRKHELKYQVGLHQDASPSKKRWNTRCLEIIGRFARNTVQEDLGHALALRDKVMPSFALTAQLLSRSFEGIGWMMGVGVYEEIQTQVAMMRFRGLEKKFYCVVRSAI